MNAPTAFPLSWPIGWKRTSFSERTRWRSGRSIQFGRTVQQLLTELDRMGVRDWDVVISSNKALRLDGLPRANGPKPSDPGVAVYFKLKGEDRVLACDRYYDVEENVRAITKHIEALRGMERWGVGTLEQAFQGYAALPQNASQRDWREVLCIPPDRHVDQAFVRSMYRQLAMKMHPDKGGSQEAMAELNAARDAALEAVA